MHFGRDEERLTYGDVVWEIDVVRKDLSGWRNWRLLADGRQGVIKLKCRDAAIKRVGVATFPSVKVRIMPPDEAGDQTVPVRSALRQFDSGMCKAVFQQEGYEHQSSYGNSRAVASTLYSIVRIAQQANGSKQI